LKQWSLQRNSSWHIKTTFRRCSFWLELLWSTFNYSNARKCRIYQNVQSWICRKSAPWCFFDV